jgi:hypothetical protein
MASGAWRRLGPIGSVAGTAPWARTHSALPATDPAGPDRWSLYVSSRDDQGRARIGRCELRLDPAPSVSPLEQEPVLDLGPLGAFDDSGVTMSCVVTKNGRKYLYYTGWSRGVTVPFYLFIGLAISDDDGRTFRRLSNAPVVERSEEDPYLTASPFVLVEGGVWRMWYVSGSRWDRHEGQAQHFYHIKYTESPDGVTWRGRRRVAVDYASDEEHAFARPCVVREGNRYLMWYSYRGRRYRIGGAQSSDGVTWTRRDEEMGFGPAGDSWESDMVAYPWVFDSDGRRYMLYNGNDYGRSGIGLAVHQAAPGNRNGPAGC